MLIEFYLDWLGKVKKTGFEGHGNWFLNKEHVLRNINYMNNSSTSRQYIEHFLETTKDFKQNKNELDLENNSPIEFVHTMNVIPDHHDNSCFKHNNECLIF